MAKLIKPATEEELAGLLKAQPDGIDVYRIYDGKVIKNRLIRLLDGGYLFRIYLQPQIKNVTVHIDRPFHTTELFLNQWHAVAWREQQKQGMNQHASDQTHDPGADQEPQDQG